MNTKRITLLGIFVTYALILNLVESWFPPLLVFAPNTRMGLANIISFMALIMLGVTNAYIVLIIRCILTVIFSGSPFSIVYSLSAGLASLTAMVLLYKFVYPYFSIVSISILGAFLHNFVQVFIYSIVAQTPPIMFIMINFVVASIIAGLVVGIAVLALLRKMPPQLFDASLLKGSRDRYKGSDNPKNEEYINNNPESNDNNVNLTAVLQEYFLKKEKKFAFSF